jgi:hypothetical protein
MMNNVRMYFIALPALMIVGSAIAKLVGAENVIKQLGEAGLTQFIPFFAAMEIVFCALWLYPRTGRVGFFLLCSYFGGAIATDLLHLQVIIAPILILSLVWLASFWRDPALFGGVTNQKR